MEKMELWLDEALGHPREGQQDEGASEARSPSECVGRFVTPSRVCSVQALSQ
jgi:hypothetical protein